MNFRLTCHRFAELCRLYFAERYFQDVYLSLHPACLEALNTISLHPKYSKLVRKLVITNDQLHDTNEFEEKAPPHIQAMKPEAAEFRMIGGDVEKLSEILPRFTHLESIHVTRRPITLAVLENDAPAINLANERALVDTLEGDDVDEWFSPSMMTGYLQRHAWKAIVHAVFLADTMNDQVKLDFSMGIVRNLLPNQQFMDVSLMPWQQIKHRIRSVEWTDASIHVAIWTRLFLFKLEQSLGFQVTAPSTSSKSSALVTTSFTRFYYRISAVDNLRHLDLAYVHIMHVPTDLIKTKSLRSFKVLHCSMGKDEWSLLLYFSSEDMSNLEMVYLDSIYLIGINHSAPEYYDKFGPRDQSTSVILRGKKQILEGMITLRNPCNAHPNSQKPVTLSPGYEKKIDMRKAQAAAAGRLVFDKEMGTTKLIDGSKLVELK